MCPRRLLKPRGLHRPAGCEISGPQDEGVLTESWIKREAEKGGSTSPSGEMAPSDTLGLGHGQPAHQGPAMGRCSLSHIVEHLLSFKMCTTRRLQRSDRELLEGPLLPLQPLKILANSGGAVPVPCNFADFGARCSPNRG